MRTLILAGLLLLISFPCPAQSSRQPAKRTLPTKAKPSTGTKTESEIALEKEVPILKRLSEANKVIIRDGITNLDHVIRLTILNGFSVDFDKDYDGEKVLAKIELAKSKLPKGVLLRSFNFAAAALLDSQLAYLLVKHNKIDDRFLSLMDTYGLRDAAPQKVPLELLNIARININMAVEIGRRANIL
jgi:hypothetical protein